MTPDEIAAVNSAISKINASVGKLSTAMVKMEGNIKEYIRDGNKEQDEKYEAKFATQKDLDRVEIEGKEQNQWKGKSVWALVGTLFSIFAGTVINIVLSLK